MSPIVRFIAAALLGFATSTHAQITLNHFYFVGDGLHCDFADIQSAIDFAAPGDTVSVVNSTSSYAGHLSIGKSLNLVGTDACDDFFPPPSSQPYATIDGSGGADAPVITISGASDVTITGLTITGGHAGATGSGGGVNFTSSGGSLTLSHDVFVNNSANEGGGLALVPPGTTVPNVYINDDVEFLSNVAFDSGAGIYVGGGTHLYVMGKGDLIAFNTAAISGGGIFVRGPAAVALGSPGLNGLLIYDNNAQYGGGIAAYAAEQFTENPQQVVSLFTTDPSSPGQIIGNRASVAGGGVYVKSFFGFNGGTAAAFCAMDYRIDYNSAPQGAAIYLENDRRSVDGMTLGSAAYLNTEPCQSAADYHAARCAPGIPCNEISGNTTVDSSNQPTDGAVVLVAGGGFGTLPAGIYAQRIVMHANSANYLFQSSDEDGAEFQLSECLTGGNTLGSEMIRMEGTSSVLDIEQCTLAPDVINSTHVMKFDNADSNTKLILLNSIIDEPGTLTLNYPGSLTGNPNLDTADIISNDIATLPGNVRTQLGTPLFVDGDNADVSKRDYHLRAYVQNGKVTASPGIDFAESAVGGNDLDGNPYDQDVPLVPNFAGPRDLGAYEAQPIADRIFADAFGDQVSLVK